MDGIIEGHGLFMIPIGLHELQIFMQSDPIVPGPGCTCRFRFSDMIKHLISRSEDLLTSHYLYYWVPTYHALAPEMPCVWQRKS